MSGRHTPPPAEVKVPQARLSGKPLSAKKREALGEIEPMGEAELTELGRFHVAADAVCRACPTFRELRLLATIAAQAQELSNAIEHRDKLAADLAHMTKLAWKSEQLEQKNAAQAEAIAAVKALCVAAEEREPDDWVEQIITARELRKALAPLEAAERRV